MTGAREFLKGRRASEADLAGERVACVVPSMLWGRPGLVSGGFGGLRHDDRLAFIVLFHFDPELDKAPLRLDQLHVGCLRSRPPVPDEPPQPVEWDELSPELPGLDKNSAVSLQSGYVRGGCRQPLGRQLMSRACTDMSLWLRIGGF